MRKPVLEEAQIKKLISAMAKIHDFSSIAPSLGFSEYIFFFGIHAANAVYLAGRLAKPMLAAG